MTKRAEAGFTLMELVVAAAFMGIVIVAISGLFIGLRQSNTTANSYTIATQVAQQLMERYRNTPYSAIAVGTSDVTTSALGSYPSLHAPRTATVTVTQVDPAGLKRVDIAISYTDRTGTRRAQLTTLIAAKGVNK